MKHNFEERRQNRIDYAKEQAAKNEQLSNDLYKHSNVLVHHIPPGQPILVGHHSEKHHRKTLERSHTAMRQSIEADNKAIYYKEKAENIEDNTSIFSDDPEAITKLKQKLQQLQTLQDFMKAANRCIKKKDKEAFLKIPGAKEKYWEELITPDRYNRVGFPSHRLTNNNGNISNTKKRLAQLEALSTKKTNEKVINEVRIVENMEANRVQLFFPAIPSEACRKDLKQSGFHWCRTEGAWQRHYSDYAVHLAETLAAKYIR